MDEEQEEARAALLKFGAMALVVAVVVALGTFVLVKALGLGGGGSGPAAKSADPTPSLRQLPTTALTPSGSPSGSPSEEPSATPAPQGIQMTMTPTAARAGERIYITGQYPGADGVMLQVQREEGTDWTPFADVSTRVTAGSFRTYVITTRSGPSSFRVYDPATGQASDPVAITVS